MSNAVSFDVMQLLDTNGFGTQGTDLFALGWGVDVDEQILLMDTEGFESERKLAYEHPGFQVLTRGKKTESQGVAYERARDVHIFLINQPDLLTINGVDYLGFEPVSSLIPLGRDSNERYTFSVNYVTYRNPE